MDNVINNLLVTKPGQAYHLLRRLGARPGDTEDAGTFTLPHHAELNLTAERSADIIAQHFAEVSQRYEPINVDRLQFHVKEILNKPINHSEIPRITEFQVWNNMKKTKEQRVV